MKIFYHFLLSFFLFFLSCSGKTDKRAEYSPTALITEEPISFQYDKNKKAILLDGRINDSIPIKLYFETGWIPAPSDTRILLSDSLRNIVKEGVCNLKLGNIVGFYDVFFWKEEYFLFQYLLLLLSKI